MNITQLLPAFPPVAVAIAFIAHWIAIAHIDSPHERLPLCRGAYLGLSLQMLLYAWFMFAFLPDSGHALLMVALGMSFSFLGDVFNLQFPSIKKRVEEPVFPGILSFLIAQFCYIAAFLSKVRCDELTANGYLYPLLAVFLVLPAITFRLRVYNPSRPKTIMRGAFIYGFVLSAMGAIAISASITRGGEWWYVAAGAVLFLISDAVMGETTIHGRHPRFEYQVPWFTYLLAQGLIIYGIGRMFI